MQIMSLDADAIIVGAGPGGASAAYFLVSQGYKVLVLEKAILPRYKTCGGAISNHILNFFPFSFDSIIEQRINRVTFAYDTKQVTVPVQPNSLAMVMRDRFDYHILQQSQAEVHQGLEVISVTQDAERVKVKTKTGETFQASYLIAADGANSRVAQALNLRKGKKLGGAIEIEVKVDKATLNAYRGKLLIGLGKVDAGYYWIFPKANHLSVGIGSFKRGERFMPKILKETMDEKGISLENSQQHAQPIPIRTRREQLQQGRVLLVGDAAGLVDPLTGEGIRHAVESAKLASDLISSGNVSAYTKRIEKIFANDLYWARLWARLIYGAQHWSFEWLLRNKVAVTDVVRILSNQISYKQTMAKLPLYLINLGSRLPLD
jgi:geranylgeranyl reductase family protein